MYKRESCGVDVSAEEEEALRLYQEAERLESDGRHTDAALCYRKAFRLCPQLEYSLWKKKKKRTPNQQNQHIGTALTSHQGINYY